MLRIVTDTSSVMESDTTFQNMDSGSDQRKQRSGQAHPVQQQQHYPIQAQVVWQRVIITF